MDAVAEGGDSFGADGVGVDDQGAGSYLVIGDVVVYVFDAAVVVYGHVVQGGVAYAGGFWQSAGQGEVVVEAAQPDAAGETDVVEGFGGECGGDGYGVPVVGLTGLCLKLGDFGWCEGAVGFHLFVRVWFLLL